ncbi:hypothetical protein B5C34_11325 [Pacificimonas flava]|uniref:DUF732 domain-containing protein n=2 Tax=Pacificimonas TaxID=1960290 RepID=A0A219B6H8_9SPHN|nr:MULTISPECIES: hypothetical protein [Pacificimonas]MBZ6378742.1 hypothetical protein [Pacificimonas aurantium]OWV33992.1 hypothetical protein B5C34_11325 [Pacificimonas flava]
MKFSKAFIAAAAPLAALVSAPSTAQAPAAPEADAPSPEAVQAAARHFALANGILQAEQVPPEVKNRLFLCIYSAPFRTISENAAGLIEANEELSLDNDDHVRQAIMFVCGYRPQPEQPAQ